jgi:hypothetical protein
VVISLLGGVYVMRTQGSFRVDVVAIVFALDIFISDTHFSARGPHSVDSDALPNNAKRRQGARFS